ELVTDRREERRSQAHALGRDVDRLGFEAAADHLSDRDQRLEVDALALARPSLLAIRAGGAGFLCASITHSSSSGIGGPWTRGKVRARRALTSEPVRRAAIFGQVLRAACPRTVA